LLLLLDGLLNGGCLLPELTGAQLEILYRLTDASELLMEISFHLRLILLPGELFSGAAFSLVQSLSIGRNYALILLIHPGAAALKTLSLLNSLSQFGLQRGHLLSPSGTSSCHLLLDSIEQVQLALEVFLVCVPLLHLLLWDIFHAV
jgi:hypothetical protein